MNYGNVQAKNGLLAWGKHHTIKSKAQVSHFVQNRTAFFLSLNALSQSEFMSAFLLALLSKVNNTRDVFSRIWLPVSQTAVKFSLTWYCPTALYKRNKVGGCQVRTWTSLLFWSVNQNKKRAEKSDSTFPHYSENKNLISNVVGFQDENRKKDLFFRSAVSFSEHWNNAAKDSGGKSLSCFYIPVSVLYCCL